MRNYFNSGAPLQILSKLYDVPIGFVPPPPSSIEAVYDFICGMSFDIEWVVLFTNYVTVQPSWQRYAFVGVHEEMCKSLVFSAFLSAWQIGDFIYKQWMSNEILKVVWTLEGWLGSRQV